MHRKPMGFTLIELLTVIAIIAILAAILFPVYSRVKENSRKTTCISNMHQIYLAVSMYHTDTGGYPDFLLAPYRAGVSAKNVKISPLYPQYIKDISIFHCPDNDVNDMNANVTVNNLVTGTPAAYYLYDSYDITSALNADGTPAPQAFIQTYSKDWTGATGPQDAPNQLKYTNPPQDKTVITWCNYHVSTGGETLCPVLFLSGTVKNVGAKAMVQYGWQIAGHL